MSIVNGKSSLHRRLLDRCVFFSRTIVNGSDFGYSCSARVALSVAISRNDDVHTVPVAADTDTDTVDVARMTAIVMTSSPFVLSSPVFVAGIDVSAIDPSFIRKSDPDIRFHQIVSKSIEHREFKSPIMTPCDVCYSLPNVKTQDTEQRYI